MFLKLLRASDVGFTCAVVVDKLLSFVFSLHIPIIDMETTENDVGETQGRIKSGGKKV